MSIVYQRVDPRNHAEAIKALFAAHDRPEFPAFFDRAYPEVAALGAESWVGMAGAELVMHIARFPHDFQVGPTRVRAGLLGNLMVAERHRTFFPALSLVRRMIADTRARGDIDFLFADPHKAAPALLKAGGFKPVGTLRRFSLVVGDARRWLDLPIRALHLTARVGAGAWRLRVERHDGAAVDPQRFSDPAGAATTVRPCRPGDLYRRRLAEFPSAADHWFLMYRGREREPAAAVLCRQTDLPGLTTVCTIWRQPAVPVRAVVLALARAARRIGATRLQLWTLEESRFAHDLQRSGFVARHETVPVLGLGITERGTRILEDVAAWETTHLDYDR